MKNVVVLNQSSNQSISSNCKSKKTSRKNNNRMFSRSSDQNISPPSNMIYHGLLQSPPPPQKYSLRFSYPPPNSIRKQQQQQPPLLPLPVTKPININRKHGIGSKEEDPKMKPGVGAVLVERLGPDPNELPRNVSGVMFSGSAIFSLSPPPSSLPLPSFFRRGKVSCNVEAGGVNLGATDNLRRLLRLQ